MSANENEFGLNVDPSEKTGEDMLEASGQDEFELNVDPSEGPAGPPE
jgi:hypothetical protein